MRLLNLLALERFTRKHADARAWIDGWRRTVEAAHWRSIHDARIAYPSADGVKLRGGAVVTVFNVRGNAYRLLTLIRYDRQDVYVLDVLTHADYDKQMEGSSMKAATAKRPRAASKRYLALVRRFQLRPIQTDEQLEAAHQVLRPLFLRGRGALTADEADYLGALSILVADYENARFPIPEKTKTPHERLQFLVDSAGMTHGDLMKLLDVSQPQASLLLSGKRELSKANAKRLADHFKLNAAYFL